MTDLQARNAELKDDRDTWKARAEFSYGQRDALQAQLDAIRAQEPVGLFRDEYEGGPVIWYQVDISQDGVPLYTHAPDSAARIAELEQSLEVWIKRGADQWSETEKMKSERDAALETIKAQDEQFWKLSNEIIALKSALREAKEALIHCEGAFDEVRGYPVTYDLTIEAITTINAALGEE